MKGTRKQESFIDRAFTAFIFCFFISFTVIIIPIYLSFNSGTAGGLKLYNYYTNWWFVTIIISSAVTGIFLGEKCLDLLGHLWYTEYPHNDKITLWLWFLLISTGAISYYYGSQ